MCLNLEAEIIKGFICCYRFENFIELSNMKNKLAFDLNWFRLGVRQTEVSLDSHGCKLQWLLTVASQSLQLQM